MSLELSLVASLGLLLASLLWWAFRHLPGEHWQMMAAVPVARTDGGAWRGINLTWYGAFTATAVTLGGAIVLVLMAAIGLPTRITLVLAAAVLAIGLPAARVVARIVERQRHTFTIGGASFIALLAIPPLILGINSFWGRRADFHIPVLAGLAAFATAYLFAEGVGRLSCISFGCCYGTRLDACGPLLRRVFAHTHFVFQGDTKKANYEGQAHGQALLPIQGITAILLVTVGLLDLLVFLAGHFGSALIIAIFASQGWRVVSEFFRADFRGASRVSAYQKMAILTMPYTLALVYLLRADAIPPVDLATGLWALWSPLPILFLQATWLTTFLMFGRSMVTASILSFHLSPHEPETPAAPMETKHRSWLDREGIARC